MDPVVNGTIEEQHGAWLLTLRQGEAVVLTAAGESARRLRGVARTEFDIKGPWLQPRPGLYVYNWTEDEILEEQRRGQ